MDYRHEMARKFGILCILLLFFPLYLKSQKNYRVTVQKLNVRQSPSTRASVVGSLILDENVQVFNINNGWAEIGYKGQRRFVSAQFLTPEPNRTKQDQTPKKGNVQQFQASNLGNTQQGREQECVSITHKQELHRQKQSHSTKKWEWDPKYMGVTHFLYNTSAKKSYTQTIGVGTLQGVQLSQYTSVALGIDIDMHTHHYKGQDLPWLMATYVNMRGYYPLKDNFTPFLGLSIGADFYIHPKPNGANFYCEFGPGFHYKKLDFNFGLQHTVKKLNHFYTKIGITL